MQAPGKTKNFITALRTVRRYKRSLRNENLKLMKKNHILQRRSWNQFLSKKNLILNMDKMYRTSKVIGNIIIQKFFVPVIITGTGVAYSFRYRYYNEKTQKNR